MTDSSIPAPAADTPAAAAQSTSDAIAAARQRLAEGGSILDADAGRDVAAPAAGSDSPRPEALTVRLDGMEERGEQPLELEAPDQETFERLTELQKHATVGRAVKEEQRGVADLRRQRTELEDMIAVDPAGFLLGERIPEQVRTEVALNLLMEPGVIESVEARLRESGHEGGMLDILDNPDGLKTLHAELKASRLEMREQLRQSTEQRRTMEANADRVIGEIERLIPESVTGEQRELLFRDAVRDVKDRVQRLGLTEIDPEDVKMLVTARLRGHQALRGAGTGGPVRSGPAAAPARRAAPAAMPAELPAGTAERIKLARKVGLKALVERARGTT